MSNATDTLKKVKAVLGLEVKMEQLKMENGTILEADKFEVGEPVFIVTEDEKVALPIGSYELEDNKMLVVEEEGIIAVRYKRSEEQLADLLTKNLPTVAFTKIRDNIMYNCKDQEHIAAAPSQEGLSDYSS